MTSKNTDRKPAPPVAEPAAAEPAPTPTVVTQHAPEPAGATNSNLISRKTVELTGFRVHRDKTGKTNVQFVVINHSEADLKGLTAHVVLRATSAKPSQPPIAIFSMRLPNIASLDSKDLSMLVESPVDHGMPDWTELRADVRVEHQ